MAYLWWPHHHPLCAHIISPKRLGVELIDQCAYCAHTGLRRLLVPGPQQRADSGDLQQIVGQRSNAGKQMGCKGGEQQWKAG